jgi:TatD DNase family protein
VVDTHCHLDHCDGTVDEVVARARGGGVRRLGAVGMTGPSIEHALAAARAHDEVVAIVGRHPNESTGFNDADLGEVERAAHDPQARAIGETGLDFYRDGSPREDQRRAFAAHIDLARRTGLPLIIHTRAAEDETFATLRERADGLTVVLHCFSAPDRLEECVARGWLCSFAGNLTYPRSEALRAAARDVPAELLLVETDAPFLSPQPVRGRPNEPANVVLTAEALAELRGVTYEELERTVEENAARVLGS